MLNQCGPTISDAGPTSNQHWFNTSCLLGCAQPSKHKTFAQHLYNGRPMSNTLSRRCTNVIQMFCVYWDVMLGIASGLVLLTAGGDYKPTPAQCLLNVGPASPVLASIHSVLVSTSCCRYLHAGGTVMMLWLSVVDGVPTLAQHWVNVSCLTSCTIESAGRNEWDRTHRHWSLCRNVHVFMRVYDKHV